MFDLRCERTGCFGTVGYFIPAVESFPYACFNNSLYSPESVDLRAENGFVLLVIFLFAVAMVIGGFCTSGLAVFIV